MSKPEILTASIDHLSSGKATIYGKPVDVYTVRQVELIRLTDHEAAMKSERQIGFAAAFDVLTYRSANTDNDILAEELDDLAHDLLESAPDWKDRWKQIHKMNEERAADKARIAELERLLADIKAWDIGQLLAIPRAIRKRIQAALSQQGKENES